MEEVELVKRFQQGDKEAFALLFEAYKQKAQRTIYLITENAFTSEDVVQEVFIQCYLQISKLKEPAYFKAWFYKILIRAAWNYSKKEKKVVPVEKIYDYVEEGSEKTEPAEEYILLQEEIEKLPLKQKTVLVLYYYNDLSIKEISRATGLLEGTVKSRLHSARKRLQQTVAGRYREEERAYG